MRILKASIDGYGKLTGRTLDFAPGLQVILGPNEQGKSTLRSFIADMLYGQKRGTGQRTYDETNELRLPWTTPDCYGGRLVYLLDDGREIEVFRNFDRKRESIQVYDRTNAREITGDFDLLRNREVNFAHVHLGMSKEVFLNTATISHFSLEDLGDSDALNQIREKLLSLADTGEESSSADAALKLLKARIAEIGQPSARTRPLPAARARLAEISTEWARAQALHREVSGVAETRRAILEEIAALRRQRLALEEDLRLLEAHERARRLQEAEALIRRIDTATQHCFALGAVREFPLNRSGEVQRAENLLLTARRQLERTQAEQRSALAELEAERRQMGRDALRQLADVPEELENRLGELKAEAQRLKKRLQEIAELVEAAESRLRDAQESLQGLPDFSGMAADPAEVLMQLASSFRVALKNRDEERAQLESLREETTRRRIEIAEDHALFRDVKDFPELAREYELSRRMHDEKIAQRETAIQNLRAWHQSVASNLPQYYWLAGISALAAAGLGAAWLVERNDALLYPAGLLGLGLVYLAAMIALSRARLRRIEVDTAHAERELAEFSARRSEEAAAVETLIEQSGCDGLRELEEQFQRYREASAELTARIGLMRMQEMRTEEAEDRIARMLLRFRETFEKLGEQIEDENDVEAAAGRATARYQRFREARRHLAECRRALEEHQREQRRLAQALEQTQRALVAAGNEARQIMQDNGFEEHARHEQLGAALRAYRARVARHRELRARLELLQEKLHAAERRLKAEELDVEKQEQELARLLAHAGVSSIEQWHTLAAQAREYQEVWAKRAALEQQLEAVLRGEDLHALRESVQAAGELPPPSPKTREAIKQEIAAISGTIDDRMKEEHALHIKMTMRSAGSRSMNEIEEEKAALERRVAGLQLELDAAARAAALIEEIARDKHARIAPKLAERASGYLDTITGGAYSEILISRDLNISVRIPQTRLMNERPEKSLSKGTVDQVYLALRLALVQSVSESGESIPMLLDDPFANYDDRRLAATMRLIREIAVRNQVILFTCREDVARAAQEVRAPVMRL